MLGYRKATVADAEKSVEDKRQRKSKVKAVTLCLVAILLLVVAQLLAQLIGGLISLTGIPVIDAVTVAILYPVFAFFLVKVFVEKGYKYSLKELRIDIPRIRWYWVLAAVLLPLSVITVFAITGGELHRLNVDTIEKISVAIWGIFYYSIAAGIVEELTFRGVIMGVLEKEFNLPIALGVPSVLFGAVHMIGEKMSFASMIQLVAAGTMVGIMFSLVCCQSNNIWNNILMHAVWNMSTVGLFHIGTSVDGSSLYTLVIHSDSQLMTGGDFGVEASLVAIAGYVMVSVIAFALLKIKPKKAENVL